MTAARPGPATDFPALIELPPSRFFHGDAPGEACPEVIDLTGLNRILVYGPFVALPSGPWRATVRLELCEHAARRPFRLDFASGAAITDAPFAASARGPRSVSVVHDVSADAPIELRLWLLRPTFHGELRFLGATLERVDGCVMKPPANDASA